jgi:hypothetical protein
MILPSTLRLEVKSCEISCNICSNAEISIILLCIGQQMWINHEAACIFWSVALLKASEMGQMLSQWRGYCGHWRGVTSVTCLQTLWPVIDAFSVSGGKKIKKEGHI